MEAGKLAFCCAISGLVLLAKDNKKNFQDINYIFLALILPVLFFGYAIWQHYFLHLDRVLFSSSHATSAAYILLFCSLFSLVIIIKSKIRFYKVLFIASFFISLWSVITTETRAVIIVYPVLTLLILIADALMHKKIEYKLYAYFSLIFIVSLFIFKDTINTRLQDLSRDINLYSNNNTVSSVGARFAMYEAGIKTFTPLGQSLEKRAEKIHELEIKEPRLKGALPYIDSHLHNDLIDTLSTRGALGVLSVLFIYFSFAYYSIRYSKEPYILIVIFALILIGLSDVALFAKSVPAATFASLLLLCAFSGLSKNVGNNKR